MSAQDFLPQSMSPQDVTHAGATSTHKPKSCTEYLNAVYEQYAELKRQYEKANAVREAGERLAQALEAEPHTCTVSGAYDIERMRIARDKCVRCRTAAALRAWQEANATSG